MSVALDDWVEADPTILATEIDGEEVVLLDVASGRYFSFEAVAGAIWRMIREPREVGAMCDDLATRHDAPIERIRDTVTVFLATLIDRRLARIVNA